MVPPGDPAALATALNELLGDERERRRLSAAAAKAAAGPYSWDEIGGRTIDLYRSLRG
jgi:glycosyltransferase involved in cell wall biosynthesis